MIGQGFCFGLYRPVRRKIRRKVRQTGLEKWWRKEVLTRNQRDAIFIHIPKTAGTSINVAIRRAGGFVGVKSPDIAKAFPNRGVASFDHNSLFALRESGLVEPAFIDAAFTFTVVRNPFDRFVSLWQHSCQANPLLAGLSLDEFAEFSALAHIEQPRLMDLDGTWFLSSQTSWLVDKDGVLFPDLIGRFEALDSFCLEVSHALKIDFEIPHLNRSRRSLRFQDVSQSSETRKTIESLYAEDFENFDYA